MLCLPQVSVKWYEINKHMFSELLGAITPVDNFWGNNSGHFFQFLITLHIFVNILAKEFSEMPVSLTAALWELWGAVFIFTVLIRKRVPRSLVEQDLMDSDLRLKASTSHSQLTAWCSMLCCLSVRVCWRDAPSITVVTYRTQKPMSFNFTDTVNMTDDPGDCTHFSSWWL